jgi:hypothetical protein
MAATKPWLHAAIAQDFGTAISLGALLGIERESATCAKASGSLGCAVS